MLIFHSAIGLEITFYLIVFYCAALYLCELFGPAFWHALVNVNTQSGLCHYVTSYSFATHGAV